MHGAHRLWLSAIAVVAAPFPAAAFEEDFSKGFPPMSVLLNADGMDLQPNIYAHIGDADSVAWFCGALFGNRMALSPTRHPNGAPAEHIMQLPPVAVNEGAVLRWDARSLHTHLSETYRVDVRTATDQPWTTIYTCPGESYQWRTVAITLDDYAGADLCVRFVATTASGFILAIDNILIGKPSDLKYSFTSATPHFVSAGAEVAVTGSITNHGIDTPWHEVRLYIDGEAVATVPIATLAFNESADIAFPVEIACGNVIGYNITAVDTDGGETVLYTDFINCSHYKRNHYIDHCTATWCNNCPTFDITSERLRQRYGSELIVASTHVRDYLTEETYWNDYLSEICFAVPILVADRDAATLVYSLDAGDYYERAFSGDTQATVSMLKGTMTADGEVRIEAEAEFAVATDNSADSYRLGYMLVADIHDPVNGFLIQRNSATNSYFGEYYYHPEMIRPEMMFYDNVPVETSVSVKGVPLSLPAAIEPQKKYSHSFSLKVPDDYSSMPVKVVAMIIDTSTLQVMNAAIADVTYCAGIEVLYDTNTVNIQHYDIYGRPATERQKGILVTRNGKYLRL